MNQLIGQTLGRYHVIEALGEGGMASVFKAFDTSLERHVAIKIIRSDKKEGTEQNEFLKRFQREAFRYSCTVKVHTSPAPRRSRS